MSTRARVICHSSSERNAGWRGKQKGEVDGSRFFSLLGSSIAGGQEQVLRFNDCFLTPLLQLSASLSTVRRR